MIYIRKYQNRNCSLTPNPSPIVAASPPTPLRLERGVYRDSSNVGMTAPNHSLMRTISC